jgi:hypothetical protein
MGKDVEVIEIIQNASNIILADYEKCSGQCDEIEKTGQGEGGERRATARTKVLGKRVSGNRQCITGFMQIKHH